MKKVLLLVGVLFTMVAVSCSKDDDKPQNEAKFSASFEGEFVNGETSSEMTGTIKIDKNNIATLDFTTGKLVGTATEDEGDYTLTITQASGVFQNITNISGEINTSANTLMVSGKNSDGAAVYISGDITVTTSGGATSNCVFCVAEEQSGQVCKGANGNAFFGNIDLEEPYEEFIYDACVNIGGDN